MLDSVEDCLKDLTRREEEVSVDGHYGEVGSRVYDAFYGSKSGWIDEGQKDLVDGLMGEDVDDVLGLACGGGRILEHVDVNYDVDRLVGVDYSEEMVGLSRERNSSSVEVYQGSFLDLDFLDGEFDLVFMLGNPINHYEDSVMDEILLEVSRVLDGRFVYNFVPTKNWRKRNLDLEKVRAGDFSLTRASCTFSEEEKREYYKGLVKMTYLVEDLESGESNKVNVNDLELYSHSISTHEKFLEKYEYDVNSIREWAGRTLVDCEY